MPDTDNSGNFNQEPMSLKEKVEAEGYTFDEAGYERYAKDRSQHDADILFGYITEPDPEDPEEQDARSAIEAVLARHNKTMAQFDIQYDIHSSVDLALLRGLGINPSELYEEQARRGEREPKPPTKRGLGRSAVRAAKKKKEPEQPF
jgi:hypothetical protein